MDDLSLVTPTLGHKHDAMDFRREWGDTHIDGGQGLHNFENYEDWLAYIEKVKNGEFKDFVRSTVYFAIDNNKNNKNKNKIVGMVDIRHDLNDALLIRGGHIGYGVRPCERKKGYATKMLALALRECKHLNINKVLVTCDKNNTASAKTIEKNGGVLENEFTDDAGGVVLRYWIDIPNSL